MAGADPYKLRNSFPLIPMAETFTPEEMPVTEMGPDRAAAAEASENGDRAVDHREQSLKAAQMEAVARWRELFRLSRG